MSQDEQEKGPETLTIMGTADIVSDRLGVVKKHARPVVSAAIDAIREHLEAGGHVILNGLGSFQLRVRKEREAHNPMNPEEKVTLPEHVVIFFKPAKRVKQAVMKIPAWKIRKMHSNYHGKAPIDKLRQTSSSSTP